MKAETLKDSSLAPRDDWDSHWQNYADASEVNPAEAMRFSLILKYLGIGTQHIKFLDVGSGQGDMINLVARRHSNAELFGVELSKTGIEIAQTKVPSANFQQWDLLDSGPVPTRWTQWATHAVCSEVLEHVDDPVLLIKNARKFMAPGCRLVVTVPGGPRSAFDHHIGHRQHFTPSKIRTVLEAAGFTDIETFGAGFPFFNLYRLVVIARGRRLINDVSAQDESGKFSLSARFMMKVFGFFFHFNLGRMNLGWQTIAIAKNPEGDH